MFKFAIGLLFLAQAAFAQTLSVKEKLNDFDQLGFMIESQYGPYHFKKDVLGLDLEALKAKYRAEVERTQTNADFYYLMVRYVAEFRDGHFSIRVPTTFAKSIPVTTDLVEGKILIDTVDRKLLPESEFKFGRGDEIVSIDGKPASEFLEKVAAYMFSGNEQASRRKAAQVVFYRSAAFMAVPSAELTVEIRRGTSDIVERVTLKWRENGEPGDESPEGKIFRAESDDGLDHSPYRTRLYNLSNREVDEQLIGQERFEKSYRCSGTTRIEVPKDAVKLVSEPFVAYYHPTPKGHVGYLRIPHYSWGKAGNPGYHIEVYNKYLYAISELEKNTVGLIIDQDHNCGGSVDFLERITGLFMDRSFEPLMFELRANKKNYVDALAEMKAMVPDTLAYKHHEKTTEVIKDTWARGDYLTAKLGLTAPTLYPSPIHYSKPIVMTIDELSGSGGDAFPAMMQGYGRAILVGQRTAGLGGHVSMMPELNNSAMKISMTQSLFYRPDGVPVENNGAVPDIEYVITRDDFMYGYKNYQKFYLNVLFGELEKQSRP